MLIQGKSIIRCNECKNTFIGDTVSGGIVYMPSHPVCTCPKCGSGNVSLWSDALKTSVVKKIKDIIN